MKSKALLVSNIYNSLLFSSFSSWVSLIRNLIDGYVGLYDMYDILYLVVAFTGVILGWVGYNKQKSGLALAAAHLSIVASAILIYDRYVWWYHWIYISLLALGVIFSFIGYAKQKKLEK